MQPYVITPEGDMVLVVQDPTEARSIFPKRLIFVAEVDGVRRKVGEARVLNSAHVTPGLREQALAPLRQLQAGEVASLEQLIDAVLASAVPMACMAFGTQAVRDGGITLPNPE